MNGWKMPFTGGLPETGCGAGSTVTNTANVRAWLPMLFLELDVKTLLDAPCGDFNWMARTNLSGIDYIGVDYDAAHCRETEERDSVYPQYRPRTKTVMESDLCQDRLPLCADMILCRDFLQHLPSEQVALVLINFLLSGIPWLVATSHTNITNEDISDKGMFRPLNLTQAPFGLPIPHKWITDGDGRILGLWHNRELVVTC
jgi:hypothetical protein